MKNTLKLFRWFVTNGAFFWLLWIWLFNNVAWAQNVFTFFFWLAVVLMTLAANEYVHDKEDKRVETAEKLAYLPRWLSAIYDLAVIALLSAFGHWIMGIAWTWELICEAHLRGEPK